MLVCVQNKRWAVLVTETSHKVWVCGTLLGVLCSCRYANVSGKNTYFLFLLGKSSFCEDGFENLRAEKGAWSGISSLDMVRNGCVGNCGAAVDEMKGNFNMFSFSFLKPGTYTIPSETYACYNRSYPTFIFIPRGTV